MVQRCHRGYVRCRNPDLCFSSKTMSEFSCADKIASENCLAILSETPLSGVRLNVALRMRPSCSSRISSLIVFSLKNISLIIWNFRKAQSQCRRAGSGSLISISERAEAHHSPLMPLRLELQDILLHPIPFVRARSMAKGCGVLHQSPFGIS